MSTAVCAFNVESKARNAKILSVGASHGLLFGVKLAPAVEKRVTSAALNRERQHHPYRHGSIFFRELFASGDLFGIKVRGDVLVCYFTVTHGTNGSSGTLSMVYRLPEGTDSDSM
jgi:hypothetical protein